MENHSDLCNKIDMMKQSFFDEQFIIRTQFEELEQLQDKESPNFVQEIYTLYFKDTIRQFSDIEKIILYQEHACIQWEDLNRLLHRLRGTVISIGALKVVNEVDKMRQHFQEGDMEGVRAAFEQVKIETEHLKFKVEPYFQLLGHISRGENLES